jgi:hypothetical protein
VTVQALVLAAHVHRKLSTTLSTFPIRICWLATLAIEPLAQEVDQIIYIGSNKYHYQATDALQ